MDFEKAKLRGRYDLSIDSIKYINQTKNKSSHNVLHHSGERLRRRGLVYLCPRWNIINIIVYAFVKYFSLNYNYN